MHVNYFLRGRVFRITPVTLHLIESSSVGLNIASFGDVPNFSLTSSSYRTKYVVQKDYKGQSTPDYASSVRYSTFKLSKH